jgi:hypothetical protein
MLFWFTNTFTDLSANVDLANVRELIWDENRHDWLTAKAISDEVTVLDEMDRLAYNVQLWGWWGEDGKFRLTPWNTPPLPADIFTLEYEHVKNGRLTEFGWSRIEDLATDITVKYKYNPMRNEYDKKLYANKTGESWELTGTNVFRDLCKWGSYNAGNYERTETVELDWIRDDTTAVYAAENLMRYHCQRRRIIVFETDLTMIALQIGDPLRLSQISDWPEQYPNDLRIAVFRITKKRVRVKSFTIEYTATQVFEE